MLTGTPWQIPFKTEGIGTVGCRLSLRCDRARSYLCASRVVYLDVLSRQARWTAERLGTGEQFPGYFGSPEGEIVGHFKCNRSVLDAPDFGDEFREQARPAWPPKIICNAWR